MEGGITDWIDLDSRADMEVCVNPQIPNPRSLTCFTDFCYSLSYVYSRIDFSIWIFTHPTLNENENEQTKRKKSNSPTKERTYKDTCKYNIIYLNYN